MDRLGDRGGSFRGSMRRSVSAWRTPSSSDIFGRSGREEDDEEALRWAALEKLPTYDRLRKGILTGAGGEVREVEIQDLGYQERRNLLEKLVRNAEEDNEMFLLKLRNRMERVGIDNPMIEVRFERLNIDAEAYIGTRGIPTFLNFFVNKTMDDFAPRPTRFWEDDSAASPLFHWTTTPFFICQYLEWENFQRASKRRMEREQGRREAAEDMSEDLSEGEKGDTVGEPVQPETPGTKIQRNVSDVQIWSDDIKGKKLYIVLIRYRGVMTEVGSVATGCRE